MYVTTPPLSPRSPGAGVSPAALMFESGGVVPNESYDYGQLLCHKVDLVDRQLQDGLYVVKRCSFFLKKICDASDSYCDVLSKDTAHEKDKLTRIKLDRMRTHAECAAQIHDVVDMQNQRIRSFAQHVRGRIVKPLETFYCETDNARKELCDSHKKILKEMSSIRSTIADERRSCTKSWNELVLLKREYNSKEEGKAAAEKLAKIEKNINKAKEKAKKSFSAFETNRVQLVDRLKNLQNQVIPSLLNQFRDLELDRMRTLKKHLNLFSELNNTSYDRPPLLSTFCLSLSPF